MYTYVVANHAQTRVKIGRSNNPPTRLASLQTGNHDPLTIILILEGDLEAELHQQFAHSRLLGEWFDYGYALRKFVAEKTGQPLRMSFYAWLVGQCNRIDDIGRLATLVKADKKYPRDFNQLHLLLGYFGKSSKAFKQVLRSAHIAWRLECTKDVDGTRYAKGLAR